VKPLLATLLLVPLLPLLLVPAPAHAALAEVSMDDMAFSPAKLIVKVGRQVAWTNDDGVPHTSTSDNGFWSSPTLTSGDTYTRAMTSAGTYAYHCTFHTMMRAKVRVGMKAKGSAADGWRVAWASTDKAPPDRDFDVQYKRKGATSWTSFRSNTLKPEGTFDPAADGTYLLRARTSRTSAGVSSGWSPKLTLKIR
jgi:plastocyanin